MGQIYYKGWTTDNKEVTVFMDNEGLNMCVENKDECMTFTIENEDMDLLMDFIQKYRLDKK